LAHAAACCALRRARRGSVEIGLTPTDADNATLTLVLPQDHAVWPVSKVALIERMRLMRG
jgi:hypothetical protein